MKSAGFHEIRMKSGGFHADFTWNPADFMKSLVIAPTLHSSNWRVFAKTLAFIILGWISQVKSGWNLPDFRVKSPTLHSSNWRVFAETLAFIILGWISQVKSWWNLQISQVKSTRFQGEIPHPAFIKLKSFCWNTCFYNFGWFHRWYWVKSTRFHGWNPPDFRVKSTGFLGWNPPPCIHQTEEFLLKHLLL